MKKPTVKKFNRNSSAGRNNKFYIDIPAALSDTGKVQRQTFATRQEADAHADLLWRKFKKDGILALAMPKQEIKNARQALEILKPTGLSLIEAAEICAERHQQASESVTVSELFEECIKSTNGGKRHQQDLSQAARRLAPLFGSVRVCELAARDIEDALQELGRSPASYNKDLRYLNIVFNHAFRRSYLTENPMAKIKPQKVARKPISVLTPRQATALVESATFEFRPFFLITLFAGLRPQSEILRLDWQDIDQIHGKIWVSPSEGKETGGRFVPIEPNLAKWLQPYADSTEGQVVSPVNFRRTFEASRTRADEWLQRHGYPTEATLRHAWGQDCTRHSYATYWSAKYMDIAQCAYYLGHSETVHKKHYHKPMPTPSAEAYWAILPEQESKIIALQSAG